MKSAPLVQCSRCSGSGKVELAPLDFKTHKAIGSLGEPTIPELSIHMKVRAKKRSVLNHCIKRLVQHGLVERANPVGSRARYRQKNGE